MTVNANEHGQRRIDLTSQQIVEVQRVLNKALKPKGEGEGDNASPRSALNFWVFGSRATGRARPYSDLDLLLDGTEPLPRDTRIELTEAFEASELPFRVDVVEASRLAPGMVDRVLAERLPLPVTS